jgi:ATP-dependent DNA ligase
MTNEQVMLGTDGTLADLHKDGWLYQPKWDGNRGKAIYTEGDVQIINRRGFNWAPYLPDLTEALQDLASTTGVETFTVDGEIVAFKDGHSNLRLSNSRCATRNMQKIRFQLRRLVPLYMKLFDIMEWAGTRYESKPFSYRCSVLEEILQVQNTRIHLTPTYDDPNQCWQEWVVQRQEEGVMVKDPTSPYIYDRSPSWIKVKARERGIFNVCGYTKGDGRRGDLFGALVILDDNGQLKGRCGGGFTDADARRILQVLKLSPVTDPPFSVRDVGDDYTPIDTPMKVEIIYQMMNGDTGKLRSPQLARWWMPK